MSSSADSGSGACSRTADIVIATLSVSAGSMKGASPPASNDETLDRSEATDTCKGAWRCGSFVKSSRASQAVRLSWTNRCLKKNSPSYARNGRHTYLLWGDRHECQRGAIGTKAGDGGCPQAVGDMPHDGNVEPVEGRSWWQVRAQLARRRRTHRHHRNPKIAISRKRYSWCRSRGVQRAKPCCVKTCHRTKFTACAVSSVFTLEGSTWEYRGERSTRPFVQGRVSSVASIAANLASTQSTRIERIPRGVQRRRIWVARLFGTWTLTALRASRACGQTRTPTEGRRSRLSRP